ncbi:ABC transporter substrate-binding protein [Actibacterium pelagium]|uniref:Periplasmic iron-binding protein n=1 Tax=Actibacterium pelagium TaxID=2029103 RepID=A0A917AI19_9RHOB|nr:ABC transporter substrate-binding protein [Actibacterium pelagium]GGE54371.1 periplasmic iron-binding protein [Actibacterium pelagium]
MRSLIFSLGLMCLSTLSNAFEAEDHAVFGDEDAGQVLRIISTADIAFFKPMIQSYLSDHPDVAVDYTVASSSELMRALYEEDLSFDLAISSAMDLQTKLANDGLAQRHSSSQTQNLPDWAVWNEMVFAFTQEPAAFVISNKAFEGLPLPENRQQLINILRQNPEIFRGRVGTYDIRQSGSGYLFATQDARASDTYWRLTEVIGTLDPKLYCCTADMIDDVVSGELAIAYNVLASYAEQSAQSDAFTIILPSDFAIVMLRTVLIPTSSEKPELAAGFLDFVLSQTFPRGTSPLLQSTMLDDANQNALHRIRLGPGLLVYLDQFKNRSFIAEWESAILQD